MFVALISDQGETALGELRLFRTRMLRRARAADLNHEANEANEARTFGELAEAALDNMAALGIQELDDARTYSKALHDVFTRTFAGQTISTGRGGASRIPPEIMMRRALGTG